MNEVGNAVVKHLEELGVRYEDVKYSWVTFRKVEKAKGVEQAEEYGGHVEFYAWPDSTGVRTHFALHYVVKDLGPVHVGVLTTDERSMGVLRDTHHHREIIEDLLTNELQVVAKFMGLWWYLNHWRFQKGKAR